MRTILIAEDDKSIREGLERSLAREGYRTLATDSGDQVQDIVRRERPDLVLLDVILPNENGVDVCRRLRHAGYDAPIIMMSAEKSDEIDRVVGLRIGADDYVLKPFGIHELLARIDACLRRYPTRTEALTGYCSEELEIDFLTGTVRRAGEIIRLTSKEYALLAYLVRKRGQTVTREELLDHIWGLRSDTGTRTVDTHILSLRKRLELDPENPKRILSERGSGYRFT